MTTSPVRIAVYGASGRMGLEVLRAIQASSDCELAAAMVRAASPLAGEPLRRLLGDGSPDMDFRAQLDPDIQVDVVIDFSSAEAMPTAVAMALERGAAYLGGSTGLEPAQWDLLQHAAGRIALLWSANFSLGVAVLKRAVAMVASQLGAEFDAEILEIHHRFKRDAPSGTALAIGRAIADARGQDFDQVACFERCARSESRQDGAIGFAVMRAADVVGEHTVVFASAGERLELTHRANSRAIFAKGAVRSACWLSGQAPGWYDLSDVLS